MYTLFFVIVYGVVCSLILWAFGDTAAILSAILFVGSLSAAEAASTRELMHRVKGSMKLLLDEAIARGAMTEAQLKDVSKILLIDAQNDERLLRSMASIADILGTIARKNAS